MVAKFSETPVPRPADTALHSANAGKVRGYTPADLALRGQLILEKASTLEHVTAGGHGLAHFEGVALRVAGPVSSYTVLRFAVALSISAESFSTACIRSWITWPRPTF